LKKTSITQDFNYKLELSPEELGAATSIFFLAQTDCEKEYRESKRTNAKVYKQLMIIKDIRRKLETAWRDLKSC
jgi:hypothetical protein